MRFFFIPVIFVTILGMFSYFNLTSNYEYKYQDVINKYSTEYNIEPSLIYAIIESESGFDPYVISGAGAYGLMQIMPNTAEFINNRTMAKEELFDIETNIATGTKYLDYLFKRFDDINSVICAYNAGEYNVKQWLKEDDYCQNGILTNTPFKATNAYLEKVLKVKHIYEKLYFNS